MEKTALQQLIFEIENTLIGNRWEQLRDAMLELERQQIIDAYEFGGDYPEVMGEQYYNKKFTEQK